MAHSALQQREFADVFALPDRLRFEQPPRRHVDRLVWPSPRDRQLLPARNIIERYAEMALWMPRSQPLLAWMTYRPLEAKSVGAQRMERFSYQRRFGGCLMTSLYPWLAKTREIERLRADTEMTDLDLETTAFCVAGLVRRWRIRHLVVATGDLDGMAADHLANWLNIFRDNCPRIEVLCIGTNPGGWPMSVARCGRQTPETLTFMPWTYPAAPKPLLSRLPA